MSFLDVSEFPFDGALLARPGQRLEQHLSAVRKALQQIAFKIPFYSVPVDGLQSPLLKEKNFQDQTITLPEWLILDLLKILVATHDFGKVSPYFQAKIRKIKIGNYDPLSYHTKTSAFFAFFLLDEYFERHKNLKSWPKYVEDLFKVLIPYSIINHHTPKIKTTFLNELDLKAETLVTLALIRDHVNPHQYSIDIPGEPSKIGSLADLFTAAIGFNPCNSIDHQLIVENALQRLWDLVHLDPCLEPKVPEWAEIATDEFYELLESLEDLWETNSKLPIFMPAFLFLHAVLGDLDEWDARTFQPGSTHHSSHLDWNHQFPIDFNAVEEFKLAKFNGKTLTNGNNAAHLINLRNELFNMTSSIKLQDTPHAYILEAPTGSAKTLGMLNLALRLAEKKQKRSGKAPRIIYALPFIAITDQVGEVLAEVLLFAGALPDDALTIHHMFADFPSYIYDPSFDEEKDEIIVGRASASTRLWHAPFIATTFVSLMNTIFSGVKRNILRFHRLVGSVIILDEVQSLPPKYWEILSQMLDHLIRFMHIDFIIGSATNPKPLSHSFKRMISPQVDQSLLNHINRYRLLIHNQAETVETAIERIVKEIKSLNSRQVMIVVNTKRTCRTIYNALTKYFSDNELFLLSTWLRPFDRKKTIEAIRHRLDENQPVILVATQVIEAGVDLDFRTVYRDFAPIDSIIQVAGRCNRNYQYDFGTIHILNLVNEDGKSFASLVYDKVSLEVTRELLTSEMDELETRKSVHAYFDLVKQRRITTELLPEFQHSDIPTLAEKFNLIDDQYSVPIAIIPQSRYNSLNFSSKFTIKVLSIFSISIRRDQIKLFNHIKRKISGIEVLIAIEEDNPNYDRKGGFNP